MPFTRRKGGAWGFKLVDRLEHLGAVRPQPPRTRTDGKLVTQQHARRNLSTLVVVLRLRVDDVGLGETVEALVEDPERTRSIGFGGSLRALVPKLPALLDLSASECFSFQLWCKHSDGALY